MAEDMKAHNQPADELEAAHAHADPAKATSQ